MNKTLVAAIGAAFLNLAVASVYAADSHESHHAGTEVQKSYAVEGEVVSVDQDSGKAKIRHDAIPELGWSGMTMVFPVTDKALLKDVKAGDKIDFRIAKDATSGQYAIQALQRAQ